ncbi:MAG: hypothetical protein FWF86_02555 [Clostridia bacterium]|nr:hypothetical protein [Clostridia bacterium]
MPREIYEVVSQGARYWFIFLMAMIAWRSYRWLARDRRRRKKRLRLLPDAGYVGEFMVQLGNVDLPMGTALPVPREGVLGTVRGCDLCVPVRGVLKKHLWLRYEDGAGLRARPFGRHPFEVDGISYRHAEDRRKGLLVAHGSQLRVGDAVLRLRMFAGFETAGPWTGDPISGMEVSYAAEAEDYGMGALSCPDPLEASRGFAGEGGAEGSVEREEGADIGFEEGESFQDVQADGYPAVFDWPRDMGLEEDILDEELADEDAEDAEDADEPPKSLYVGPDEAERAKQVLWDRFLGRGGKR